MTGGVRIELAVADDVAEMQRVEVDAGRRFAEVGLGSIAADPQRRTPAIFGSAAFSSAR